jgi:transposase
MPTHKSKDYKETAVNYYLVEDKTQEEVCKVFKCSPRSLMRWVERYYERPEKYVPKNKTRKITKNYK